MARKITLDSSNTLDLWIQKQNEMSDYMGDLDSLSDDIKSRVDGFAFGTIRSGFGDSNFVTAINGVWDSALSNIYLALYPGSGGNQAMLGPPPIKSPIFVDSGTFGKIDIGHMYAADSYVNDSYERGDSSGSTGITVASFLYDLHVADSAQVNNLSAPIVDGTSLDSAIFDNIMLRNGATMTVDTLDYDSSDYILFHNLRLDNLSQIDSTFALHDVMTGGLTVDSVNFDFATIDSATINNDITIDNVKFDGITKMEIIDKDGSTVLFAGYLLDSV